VSHQMTKSAKDRITFKSMTSRDLDWWNQWREEPHVKEVWFIEGYEPADYILEKLRGNGYDYPYLIELNHTPIGYIQCSDLTAYRQKAEHPKGLGLDEPPGTFIIDLFIGEAKFLNQGYGTRIVKLFTQYVFEHFDARKILIDPASTNKRAIRCYEKAGFEFVKTAFDGIMECTVMQKLRK